MRSLVACVCSAVLGLAMIFCGSLVPAHLRAVDGVVLQKAANGTPSLIDEGLSLVKNNHLGPAEMFLAAGQSASVPDTDKLKVAVDDLGRRYPSFRISGGAIENEALGTLLKPDLGSSSSASDKPEPFTEFIVRSDNRTKALEWLQASHNPLVQALLKFRSVTNTVLFPSSSSASGQALDTAVSIGGLLAEAGHLSKDMSKALVALMTDGNNAGDPQPVEQVLMDLMSLGQQFNWGQLAVFVGHIKDTETLRVLSNLAQAQKGESLPVIYTAVCLTGNAAGVATYLTKYSETGLDDLRLSLSYGAGGINELLQRNQRLCKSSLCNRARAMMPSGQIVSVASELSQKTPRLALAAKWSLYLLGGFLLASALHFARRVPAAERPLEVRGFHVAREFLFALGFLLFVLLLSEPFLAQDSQKGTLPFRLRLPTVGSAVAADNTSAHKPIMNQLSLMALLLFFVLQALIYIACLVKLAEIRRQNVAPRLKLKLLENEDHLFDAGLYLGFVGTIISLILVSLGVIKPSLMAAYSSTSFGILFVSFFKIFHLRPLRRKLLLQVEDEPPARLSAPIEAAAPVMP